MCDLAGFVGKPNRLAIEAMLGLISPGNEDATGVALHLGCLISTLKAPGSASSFITPRWRAWYDVRARDVQAGLLHARLATHGSPLKNENNHPHYSAATGSVLVHKGVVWPRKRFPAVSECDSEQLLHSLDHLGLVGGVRQCLGWATIGYIRWDDPGTLWLYTSGCPLYIARVPGLVWFTTRFTPGMERTPIGKWMGLSISTGELKWGPTVSMHLPTPVASVTPLWPPQACSSQSAL